MKSKFTVKKRIALTVSILIIGIIIASLSIIEVRRSHAINSNRDQEVAGIDTEDILEENSENVEEVEVIEPEPELEEEAEPEPDEEPEPEIEEEAEIEPEEEPEAEESEDEPLDPVDPLEDDTQSQEEKPKANQSISDKFKEGKVAYLTFDDGPSTHVTPMILDILEDRGIKATFFALGLMAEQNPQLINRIHEDGHVLGNHSYSHNYNYIYKNSTNFKDDLIRWENTIKDILGQDYSSNLFRFPGGSFQRKKKYHDIAKEMGYEIFDWNVVNGDGEVLDSSHARLIKRFKETLKDKRNPIILMHDTDAKLTTAESLNEIIDFLINEGYVFDTLNYYKER